MKKILLIIFLFFTVSAHADTPTWNLTNQDCDALDGGWSSSLIGGTFDLVTEDGRSCYKLTCPYAQATYPPPLETTKESRVKMTTAGFTTDFTYEIVFKMNDINIAGCEADVEFYAVNNSDAVISAWHCFNSKQYDGYPHVRIQDFLAANNIRGYIDAGFTAWHTMRMVVKNGYATVWYDGLLLYTGLGAITAPSYSLSKEIGVYVTGDARPYGTPDYSATGHPGVTRVLYIDSIKASSTAAEPDVIAPIKIQGQNVVSRIAQKGGTGWIAQSPLRYQKTNCKYSTELTYEIPLVTTADTNASKIRIYTGSDTKSLMKLPIF
jgi:hypothetical protein